MANLTNVGVMATFGIMGLPWLLFGIFGYFLESYSFSYFLLFGYFVPLMATSSIGVNFGYFLAFGANLATSWH